MPQHPAKRKFQREPVLASLLAPVIVWLAARFGFHVDADTATWIAGVLLAAAAWYARSRVTPLRTVLADTAPEQPRQGP